MDLGCSMLLLSLYNLMLLGVAFGWCGGDEKPITKILPLQCLLQVGHLPMVGAEATPSFRLPGAAWDQDVSPGGGSVQEGLNSPRTGP